jgi:DNA repair exonuclease SbcCD ATPase subunit
MTFIKGISSSVSIFVNPEPQTEETPQSQPQTNLGIANSADAFEAATANSFNLLQSPEENLPVIQQSSAAEQSVDASSIFNNFEQTAQQPDAKLQELRQRLNSNNERRKEIQTEIESSKQKALELQDLAQQIRNSANNDQALSNSMLSTLGGLGVLGLIGGFPAPIIGGLFGGLGIFGGLSAADKDKMNKAAAELEKQAGELNLQCEQSNSELCNCDNEASDIRQRIEEEERKLQLGLDEQRFKPSLMSVEGPFQEFQPDGIIQEEIPSAVQFNPDVQKLTNKE